MFRSPSGSFDVQPIGQFLELIPAEAAGWLAVAAGLAVFVLLLRWDQQRKDRRNMIAPAPPAQLLEPGSDWRKIMDVSLAELERAPDLQSMQAHAALQIDAAEHAFNRLIAECAKVSTPRVAPTFAPLQQLPAAPDVAAPAQQQPLAA